MSPLERRGKHVSRPNQKPIQVVSLVEDHVRSLKPRQSHYSLRQNPHATYLPETLSVKQMHAIFLDNYRIAVPYNYPVQIHAQCVMNYFKNLTLASMKMKNGN
ncbi:hypothetical protein PR048_012480 [Dryococelus australis]|uniref:Uncharacterized protein n=1 Tax=Dryococelus australis TaxID=614101 RepID=A0ABQ9HPN8_9NEOP|nr:hypothetical protein PR048_012480 [Dryococelus australis]